MERLSFRPLDPSLILTSISQLAEGWGLVDLFELAGESRVRPPTWFFYAESFLGGCRCDFVPEAVWTFGHC